MPLSRLLIRDFRNIAEADLTLSRGFNFLIGANGSGKTSVLEAIYALGHGRAFRSQHSGRVIRHEQAEFTLHGRIQSDNVLTADDGNNQQTRIGLTKNRLGDSTIRINGSDGHKIADLALLLPMQLITPEGFTLLNGGPKYRRSFLDWGCFHQQNGFFTVWNQLKRLLKQRNAALRQATHYAALHPWDWQLIPLAEQISQWRGAYSEAITRRIADSCQQFLPEFSLSFTFQQGWEKERTYASVLENHFERDRLLAHTAFGPHKADLRIRANGVPVEETLSRGQLKLLMCALRLAQGEFFTDHSGRHCLYLIDDFTSELDDLRRGLLAHRLKQSQSQVFVSAINAGQVQDMTDKNSKLFMIDQGKITDKIH